MIAVLREILHFLKHGAAGDVEDAPNDHPPRFTTGMGVHGGNHVGKTHGRGPLCDPYVIQSQDIWRYLK
jgi:hypothetical protein